MPELGQQPIEQPAAPAVPAAAPAPAPAKRYELPEEPVEPAESGTPAQNTAEQAPATQSEGDKPKPEVETPEQAAKREGRRFGRKLDKAYRERAEAQARADLLEKQLAEFKKPAAPEGEPKLEQFDYDPEKYAHAKAEYAKSQATKEYEAKQRTEAGKREHQRLLAAWEEKVERGQDKYEDFDSVVGTIQPNYPFTAALMEADNGEDIAHHLGKNPKEIQRIAALSPLAQAREIGKLEAALKAKPVEPKAPSKAPAPITPLTGASPVASDTPSEADDMKSWMRKRLKQVHGKNR